MKTEVQGALANATEQLAEVTGEIIPDITNRMSTLETTTFDMSESNTAANSATATRVKDLVDRLEAMQAELGGDSKQAETLRSVAAQVAELFELSSLTSVRDCLSFFLLLSIGLVTPFSRRRSCACVLTCLSVAGQRELESRYSENGGFAPATFGLHG